MGDSSRLEHLTVCAGNWWCKSPARVLPCPKIICNQRFLAPYAIAYSLAKEFHE